MQESTRASESTGNLVVLWIAILLVIIIVGGYIFLQQYTIEQEQTITVPKITLMNVTTTIRSYEPISITEYIENRRRYTDKSVDIEGYLRHTVERKMYVGEDYYYIVDDSNNSILLTNITPELKSYFPKKNTTDIPYNITGIYRSVYLGQEIELMNITPSQKRYTENQQIKEIQKEVGIEQTITKNITLWSYLFEKQSDEVQT